jgi:hypothetical protein
LNRIPGQRTWAPIPTVLTCSSSRVQRGPRPVCSQDDKRGHAAFHAGRQSLRV